MWEYFLVIFSTSLLFLFKVSINFLYKTILIYFNHLYFSFLLLYTLLWINTKQPTIFKFFFLFLIYKIYFLEIQNLILLKYVWTLTYYYHFFFELLVGLVNIHPPLFYISLILFFKIYLHNTFKIYNFYSNYFLLSKILIITLLLGGVWGWLNFAWGYLWVYDYIEYFLLIINMIIFFKFHNKNVINYIAKDIYFISFIIIFYTLLRYGFLPSRHAFLTNLTKNRNKFFLLSSFVFNFLSLIIFFLTFYFFFKFKYWSFLLIYFITTSIILKLVSKHLIFKLLTFILHIIFFFLYFLFSMHITNYNFYLYAKNYIISNVTTFQSFTYLSQNTLKNIKLNKYFSLKKFKTSYFCLLNNFLIQIINKSQMFCQLIKDVHLYLFMFGLVLFYN